MFRSSLAVAGAAVALSFASPASASQVLCVSTSAGGAVRTEEAAGGCAAGFVARQVATSDEVSAVSRRLDAIEALLRGVSRTTAVNGQDTLSLDGMNVRVTNGTGSTSFANGKGNLVVGYNEGGSVSGSHNVVVGTANSASSTGGLVAGSQNSVSGAFGAALGLRNSVTAANATVTGGWAGVASAKGASVTGGCGNVAGSVLTPVPVKAVRDECLGTFAAAQSVSGGRMNRSTGLASSVAGGQESTSQGFATNVLAGRGGLASGAYSFVAGGNNSRASGAGSGVLTGFGNTTTAPYSLVGGGFGNSADGSYSALLGGNGVTLSDDYGVFPPAP